MQKFRSSAKYRHKMDLQKAVDSRDSAGAVTKTWASISGVFCAIEPLQGRALHDAKQIQTDITDRIALRYSDVANAITPEDYRLLYNSKYYDVLYVTNVNERNREIVLMCKVTRNG